MRRPIRLNRAEAGRRPLFTYTFLSDGRSPKLGFRKTHNHAWQHRCALGEDVGGERKKVEAVFVVSFVANKCYLLSRVVCTGEKCNKRQEKGVGSTVT